MLPYSEGETFERPYKCGCIARREDHDGLMTTRPTVCDAHRYDQDQWIVLVTELLPPLSIK